MNKLKDITQQLIEKSDNALKSEITSIVYPLRHRVTKNGRKHDILVRGDEGTFTVNVWSLFDQIEKAIFENEQEEKAQKEVNAFMAKVEGLVAAVEQMGIQLDEQRNEAV